MSDTDHRHIRERLDDYIDGTLPEEEQLRIARHLDVCSLCSKEFEKMKSLLEEARNLPDSIEPRRDLWPAIRAQMRPQEVPAARERLSLRGFWIFQPRRRWRWGVGAALAAAAAAVVAILLLSSPEQPLETSIPESPEAQPALPSYVSFLTQALEYECMGAGKQLLASVGGSENRFGAEAAAAIERGMHPIDVAIEETKSALEQNPGDPELLQMLTSRYQRKLSLLDEAIRLAREV